MVLHPLFDDLAQTLMVVDDPLFQHYFTGARFDREIYLGNHHTGMMTEKGILGITTEQAGVERFHDVVEFIPPLETVQAASDDFSMIDLGAGFGFWAMHAAGLCRRRGLNFHLTLVEAEPEYLRLLHKVLGDNAIPESAVKLHRAVAISPGGGDTVEVFGECGVPFMVGKPGVNSVEEARNWYGQATARATRINTGEATVADDLYFGSKLYRLPSGWSFILVPQISLTELLVAREHTNLAVMDIQGEELRLVDAAQDVLDQRLGAIAIATHEVEIEDGLRSLFTKLGWERVLDFRMNSTNATPVGDVYFYDGYQYYRNPRHFGAKGCSWLLPALPDESKSDAPLSVTEMAAVWQCSGKALANTWQFSIYGKNPDGKKGLIVHMDSTCVFHPTSIQDHLTTPFIGLSDSGRSKSRIALEMKIPHSVWNGMDASFRVNIQGESCNMLATVPVRCKAGDKKIVTAEIPASSNCIRIVFEQLDDGEIPFLLPESIVILLGD